MNFFTRKLAASPVENSRCAAKPFGCGKTIDFKTEFRDALSAKEYHISGFCQACQDDFFDNPFPDQEQENINGGEG